MNTSELVAKLTETHGKFKVKATPEREGRNPASGEKIKIAASKKLAFSSAKSVKDLLNG
jgi:DNA-binding protein HU-beta